MRRLSMLAATAVVLALAAAYSQVPAPPAGELRVDVEDRNPWTSLRLNNDPAEFRFAVVSDRTGGHRARVFSQAVEQLNLLQPEFVVCVGDLIEGYTDKADRLATEWKEFQGYVSKLQMPFFYVPGNHDMANRIEEKLWQEKFGRRWYHFTYRGVLFLLLDSDDPPGKAGIGEEQRAYVKRALDENPGARWTVVFMHRPMWVEDKAANGWPEVEKLLAGRQYTVFVGHLHNYRRYVRNGMRYYQLATTGGASKVRGVPYGEFDHVVWVTMKREGPVLANLLLDGIYREDMTRPVTEEPGRTEPGHRPTHPVTGRLLVDGCPAPGAYVTFLGQDPETKRATRADGVVEADGTFALSTYTAFDGAPAGKYRVTVIWRQPAYDANGLRGPNVLPAKFAAPDTSGLTAEVKDGKNEFTFELKRDPAAPKDEPKKTEPAKKS